MGECVCVCILFVLFVTQLRMLVNDSSVAEAAAATAANGDAEAEAEVDASWKDRWDEPGAWEPVMKDLRRSKWADERVYELMLDRYERTLVCVCMCGA